MILSNSTAKLFVNLKKLTPSFTMQMYTRDRVILRQDLKLYYAVGSVPTQGTVSYAI